MNPAVVDIDFLPASYRQLAKKRHTGVWRAVVVVLFAACVGVAAVAQYGFYRTAKARLADVEPQYEEALQIDARKAEVLAELQAIEDRCVLRVYLRHRWPLSGVLTNLTTALPEAVALTEIKCQPLVQNVTEPQHIRSGGDAKKEEKLNPTEADLKLLREKYDSQRMSIHLMGATSDLDQLRAYVRKLQTLPLVATAKLQTMSSIEKKDAVALTQFEIEIVLQPGYGQPNGPDIQPQGSEVAMPLPSPSRTVASN